MLHLWSSDMDREVGVLFNTVLNMDREVGVLFNTVLNMDREVDHDLIHYKEDAC